MRQKPYNQIKIPKTRSILKIKNGINCQESPLDKIQGIILLCYYLNYPCLFPEYHYLFPHIRVSVRRFIKTVNDVVS